MQKRCRTISLYIVLFVMMDEVRIGRLCSVNLTSTERLLTLKINIWIVGFELGINHNNWHWWRNNSFSSLTFNWLSKSQCLHDFCVICNDVVIYYGRVCIGWVMVCWTLWVDIYGEGVGRLNAKWLIRRHASLYESIFFFFSKTHCHFSVNSFHAITD